jgi:hypothetical protein
MEESRWCKKARRRKLVQEARSEDVERRMISGWRIDGVLGQNS